MGPEKGPSDSGDKELRKDALGEVNGKKTALPPRTQRPVDQPAQS